MSFQGSKRSPLPPAVGRYFFDVVLSHIKRPVSGDRWDIAVFKNSYSTFKRSYFRHQHFGRTMFCFSKLSVVTQKGESENGGNKKTKHPKVSEFRTYVCVSVRKKCSFFGKFGVLCFLVTSVLRLDLLPY